MDLISILFFSAFINILQQQNWREIDDLYYVSSFLYRNLNSLIREKENSKV